MRMSRWLTLLASVAISACSGFKASGGSTVTYQLRAAPTASSTEAASGPSNLKAFALQVQHMAAAPGLASERIALSQPGNRLDYYAASSWSAPVPELLAAMLRDSLRGIGALTAVHDDAAPFAADYFLRCNVLRFDADYAGDAEAAPTATVEVECMVGARSDRRLIANFVAGGAERATDNRMGAVVRAFETATRAALAKLTEQTLASLSAEVAAN